MVIENNKVVKCHYVLRDGNATGELIESTEGSEPLSYIQGIGAMIPTFEQQLMGKQKGDEVAFPIKASDAYGEYHDDLLQEIPFAAFKFEPGQNPHDIFTPGEVLPLNDEQGNQFLATVIETTNDMVKVDMNHPMAGVDLYFTGHVEGVRDATSEELTHGHVHGVGVGGHQH